MLNFRNEILITTDVIIIYLQIPYLPSFLFYESRISMRFLGSLAVFLATAQAAVTADGLITTLNAFRDAATELQGEARKVDAKSCNSFQSGDGPLNVSLPELGPSDVLRMFWN